MSDIGRDELMLMLDRLAASLNLDLPAEVALNDGKLHAAQTVLSRMGLNVSDQSCTDLLGPVERAGQQRLMMSQRIGVRAATIKRKRVRSRVWTGAEIG